MRDSRFCKRQLVKRPHSLPSLQVERVRDESVGLRALQTALTLMQNPLFADDEVWEEELWV